MTCSGCEGETDCTQGRTPLFGLIITQRPDVALTSDAQSKYAMNELHGVIISNAEKAFPFTC